MKQQSKTHPARYSLELIPCMVQLLQGKVTNIIDPFGGTGERLAMIAQGLGCKAIGTELEPEYIIRHDYVVQGDATKQRFDDCTFDGAVTSPTYGNRMNDNYKGCQGWDYKTYAATLGRSLSPNSTAGVKFPSQKYKDLHVAAWRELHRVLKPGALFVLNIKDSMKGCQVIPVSQWHYDTLCSIGFVPVKVVRVSVPGLRLGANRDKRIGAENLILFRK